MESKEDIKLENNPQLSSIQAKRMIFDKMDSKEEIKLESEPKMSNLHAKRRFMITDILNSAVENAKEQQGLDMRLLFPGVTRLPMSHSPDSFQKHHSHSPDLEGDSDNEGEDDQEDDNDKGKNILLDASSLLLVPGVVMERILSLFTNINSSRRDPQI